MFARYVKYGGWAEMCHKSGVTRDLVESEPLRQKAYQVLQVLDTWQSTFYKFREYCKQHQTEIEYLNSPIWTPCLYKKLSEHKALYWACRQGHLSAVQWILDKWKVLHIKSAFKEACKHGQVLVVKCLSRDPRFTPHMYQIGFDEACLSGHLALAERIYSVYKPEVSRRLYLEVCNKGHLQVLKRLYVLIVDDRMDDLHKLILTRACSKGHLEIVKWVILDLGIDANISASTAFVHACKNGHLFVAQWLANKSAPVTDLIDYLFMHVCQHGHLHLAQWLVDRFPHVDVHTCDDWAFRGACEYGNLEVAHWLKSTWPSVHFHNCIDGIFYRLCEYGDLNTAQWIISNFPDYKPLSCAYEIAKHYGYEELVTWLETNWTSLKTYGP